MSTPLVSTAWLAERLTGRMNDANVVVLDATMPMVGVTPPVDCRACYGQRHIPGAGFFDIEELSDHSTGLPHSLPTAEAFAESMAALGVGDQMTIVVYEQAGVYSAPRAWWMLRTFGAERVYLLDGGLQAWVAAGLPVEAGAVQRARASFAARLQAGAVEDFAGIERAIAGHEQILDARSAGRFAGTLPEPRAGLRSGHMPGATSVPFVELAAGGRMKTAEELRAYFAAKGVDLEKPIVTSCGSGVTAAVVSLGLELAGARSVRLYDGSWAEYASRPGAVIEGEG